MEWVAVATRSSYPPAFQSIEMKQVINVGLHFFSGVLDGRQMNLLHLQMLVPEKTPHLKCCSLMWRTLIPISPKDLVVSPGAKLEGKLLCFIFEGSSLTGQSDMRSVACMMFSTHREREKLLHGSSLVLRPCSQILG